MLDTTSSTVSGSDSSVPDEIGSDGAGPVETTDADHRNARRWWLLGGLAALAVVAGVAVNLIELDKVTVGPGGARPVENLVTVDEGTDYFDATGDILFTTVALDDRVTLWEGFLAWRDPDVSVFDKSLILGNRDEEQSRQFNQELMEDSKTTAVRVALEHLGFDVASGTGALVQGIDPDQAAADVLANGDTVVEANGKPLELGDDLVAAVRELSPGDELDLVVEDADGASREETVALGERPDVPGGAYLGIGVATRDAEFDLPFAINIDSGQVGGPSAGLAFTLAVLDVLTPGELTGGVEVATTGTINGLGEVGRVGGVAQKTAAVERAGGTIFLVPESEVEEARAVADDDLEVVGVADLQDALDALAARGGNANDLEPLAA